MNEQELRLKCVELAISMGYLDYADLIYKYITGDVADRTYQNISDMSKRIFIGTAPNN